MVTDRQARRLMKELGKGIPLSAAALRSAMSENTARGYRTGVLPSQRKQPRAYRTRPDPFIAVWPEIEPLLKEAPGLEAVTIFETLVTRPDACFTDNRVVRALSCSKKGARAPREVSNIPGPPSMLADK